MDLKSSKSFPCKILLAGEYLVLQGGTTLSLPFAAFSLSTGLYNGTKDTDLFINFYEYLKTIPELQLRISAQFLEDIHAGLGVKSTIPIGYGLGSSGALVAAIYQQYISHPATRLSDLKNELGAMESFFHQKSSGIDPLTIYINKPILFQNKNLSIINPLILSENWGLIDSLIHRDAKKAISTFQEKLKNDFFVTKLKKIDIINNDLVSKILTNQNYEVEIKAISSFQLEFFKEFIPPHIYDFWTVGLQEDSYYMKLCGAGMGGMYLVYKKNSSTILPHLISLNL